VLRLQEKLVLTERALKLTGNGIDRMINSSSNDLYIMLPPVSQK